MNPRQLTLTTLFATGLVGFAQAQTTDPTSPEAASSPHQREATRLPGAEAPAGENPEASAASSRHQQEATGGKMKMAANTEGADPGTFVKKAALGGMTEVEASKLAQSKSQDANVKKFAAQMVTDHSKANQELAGIAKGKGLNVPTSLDAEHQAIVKKLSAKSGAEFDSAYSQQMMGDHAKTVALFEGAAKSSDADIAAFAKKTLPTLEGHKEMADGLPGTTHSADAGASAPQRQ
jgi:putative membrane protein